jgi:hypothetical protein
MMSGHHPEQLGCSAPRDHQSGLDLVEGEECVVAVHELAHRLQAARRRFDDPRIHHHRLHDHPGDLAGVLGKRPLDRADVVERDDPDRVGDQLRDAGTRRVRWIASIVDSVPELLNRHCRSPKRGDRDRWLVRREATRPDDPSCPD